MKLEAAQTIIYLLVETARLRNFMYCQVRKEITFPNFYNFLVKSLKDHRYE